MKKLLLASMAVGALIAAFTPEPIFAGHSLTQAKPVEYLVKNGVVQPSHLYILARGQKPDRKTYVEAINESCAATLGWRKCR